jgi:hypothetical protein
VAIMEMYLITELILIVLRLIQLKISPNEIMTE